MLFRKPEPQIRLNEDSLLNYLVELFDLQAEKNLSRCYSIMPKIEYGLRLFNEANLKFKAINSDPDDEFTGNISTTFIKDQKGYYHKALDGEIELLEARIKEEHGATKYEKLQDKKAAYSEFLSRVLALNSNFKGVVMGYSNHMGNFKKSFSMIENNIKNFEYELSRASEQFSQYNAVRASIEHLISLQNELHAASENPDFNEASQGSQHEAEAAQEELLDLEGKKSSAEAKLSGIRNEISSRSLELEKLLSPIERAVRKYDHDAESKFRLGAYLSDPYAKIGDEIAYAEFISLLRRMVNKLSEHGIELKDNDYAVSQINLIINANIYDSIISINELRERRVDAEEELKAYDRELYAIRAKKARHEMSVKEHNNEIKHRDELKAEIEQQKHTLEKLFSDYYAKPVVVMD